MQGELWASSRPYLCSPVSLWLLLFAVSASCVGLVGLCARSGPQEPPPDAEGTGAVAVSQIGTANSTEVITAGSSSVSFACDFQVRADASLAARVRIAYDLGSGTLLHRGFKSIAKGSGALRVSGLRVVDAGGRDMPFVARYKDGWLVVHFAFSPPANGPGVRHVSLEWTLADAVCGGGGQREHCFADWIGEWEGPVTDSHVSFGFGPGLGSDLSGICASSSGGRACSPTQPSAAARGLRRLEGLRVEGAKLVYSPGVLPEGLFFSWPPRVLDSFRECPHSTGTYEQGRLQQFPLWQVALLAAVALALAAFVRRDGSGSSRTAYGPVGSELAGGDDAGGGQDAGASGCGGSGGDDGG